MIDVVVVNWNSGVQLQACIQSVIDHDSDLVQTIIVVDNGSTDGSDKNLPIDERIKLIHAGVNLGFGKACNLGAQRSECDFILFLNPDAALLENTLKCAVCYMNRSESEGIGICGVQLIDERGVISRSCSRFPSIFGLCFHAIGIDRLCPVLGHQMGEWDHRTTQVVDHVIGAFYLVRLAIFRELSGFDERFFVYLEDLDFSLRAARRGWRSVFLTEAQAFHAGGGTSRQVKARRLFYSLRSRLLFSFKHFPAAGAWTIMAITLFIEPISRIGYDLVRLRFRDGINTIHAYFLLYCDLVNIIGCSRQS